MHGTMFNHLRDYVESTLGTGSWMALLEQAGLGARFYLPIRSYPDEEIVALIGAASAATAQPVPAMLENFGEYVAPHLMAMYRHLIKPQWSAIDVLEHVEATAHRAVRVERPEASPPYLHAERLTPGQIRILYTSERRLCHVARGIIRGLGKAYGETLALAEPECMHRGAGRCVIVVTAG